MDIWLLIATVLAAGGWATAIIALLILRATRDTVDLLLGQTENSTSNMREVVGLYDERMGEMVQRLMTMRKEGWERGGSNVNPPQRIEPFVPEIEEAFSNMTPEAASMSREWAHAQREAGVPETDILNDLDRGGADQIEELIGA